VQHEIKPGCEAWTAAGSGSNADVGVLLLHGFTGSPASMRPWAEDLNQRGFTVEVPRLPGHGTHWRDLRTVTWQDLARATVAAFEDLRSRTRTVVVMGLSNGALLALRLAQTRPADLAGIVLVNPFVYTLDPRAKLLPVLKLVIPSLPGVINDIAKPDMDELGYDRLPLRAVASMTQLQKMVQAKLGQTNVPTLLFTSREDHVLGEKAHTRLASALRSDDFEHVWLERSYHVATLDYDYPVILEGSAKFAERVASVTS
jgi:carboxylesterase